MGSPVEKLVAEPPHRPLSRAVLVSALLHVGLVIAAWQLMRPAPPASIVSGDFQCVSIWFCISLSVCGVTAPSLFFST